MSSGPEREENSEKVKTLIPLAANGDRWAESFLWIIARSARLFDDLVDKDVEPKTETVISVFFDLLISIHDNPFFNANKTKLIPIVLTAINAWLDSNELYEDGSDKMKIYAHVLRDYVNELLPATAYITGGFDNMRMVSREMRKAFAKEM